MLHKTKKNTIQGERLLMHQLETQFKAWFKAQR